MTGPGRLAAAVLALGSAAGCGGVLVVHVVAPPSGLCEDGRPVRLLVDRACARGLCGFSCKPGRWRQGAAEGRVDQVIPYEVLAVHPFADRLWQVGERGAAAPAYVAVLEELGLIRRLELEAPAAEAAPAPAGKGRKR